ncbi:MAG: ABC transporter permease [bacterium]|nr:ABC transporter permease [bacterium]
MLDAALISSTLRLSAPLTFAAAGGLYSERAGIVNIALEGLMLFGAFSAAVVTYYTGSPWLGLLAACITSTFFALIHGIFCIYFQGDQIISGFAINILALGITPVFSNAIFGSQSITPILENTIPSFAPSFLSGIPVIGTILSQTPVLVWLSFIFVFITIFIMEKTTFGLRLDAAGENPAALDSVGVSVSKYRYMGVIMSGILTGLGGAYLSIAQGTQFIINMTAGRGYIALAALILANWKPKKLLFACLFFGLADACQIRLQGKGIIPAEIVQILPYLIAIIMLVGIVSKPRPPAGLGIPYHLGKRK